MNDFVFYNPTKIVFGKDKEQLIGQELKGFQIKKVLILYGKGSIKKTGLLDRVLNSLKEQDIQYVEFGGIQANPVVSQANKAKDLAKQEQVDAILAIGGGSVIDTAKSVSAAVQSGSDIWDYFSGKKITEALPVFTILTIAATGSEMNSIAVLTNDDLNLKFATGSPLLYPRVSILNPQLTFTVPQDQSAYGAIDAVAHILEPYFTQQTNIEMMSSYMENLCITIIRTSRIIHNEADDYNARAELMWAATQAFNGLTFNGVGPFSLPNHLIEHSLSALYGVAHGAGLAIVIPAWMKWHRQEKNKQFSRFAEKLFNVKSAEAGINELESWYKQLNCPTRLSEVNILEKDLDKIAQNLIDTLEYRKMPVSYTRENFIDILRLAL